MQDVLFPMAGGLGLFLVGMMLMSNGLVGFAGAALQRALVRFTGTPTKAFVSGTLVTAMVQSSSATTVTLIGFVSAGLIGFGQAIGVLIGASLGNTATGWIVAGLGLRISLGFYSLPLIGLGAMMRLLSKGRLGDLGLAVAGFGIMFLGLDTLQQGMKGLSAFFSLAALPEGGLSAQFTAVAVGLVLTAVLQSSTAAIAMTLTAMHTGTIHFEQAACLVVGASIGTTLTGALAAIGGTLHAKRTALAYILFNLGAGLVAVLLLPLFLGMIDGLRRHAGLEPGATSLAAFHSLFILVGVGLFLPWTERFARQVERLLPERVPDPAARLDDSMLALPAVALEASQRALETVTAQLLDVYRRLLTKPSGSSEALTQDLLQAGLALDQCFDFVSRVQLPVRDSEASARRIAQLHAIDHLLRLRARLQDMTQAGVDLSDPAYAWALENSREILARVQQGLDEHDMAPQLPQLELDAVTLASLSRQVRHDVLQQTLDGQLGTAEALRTTDAFRWLARTGHHIWRIGHHLAQGRAPTAGPHPVSESRHEAVAL